MRTWIVFLWVLAVLLVGGLAPFAGAQDDACPAQVAEALETVGTVCAGLGLNQVCYGNTMLEGAGSAVPLGLLGRLTTMPDEIEAPWGALLAKATLDEQPVSFLLMGSSVISGGDTSPPDVAPTPEMLSLSATVSADPSARVRVTPFANSEQVGSALKDDVVAVLGTNQDRAWYQIELDDGTVGWVFGTLITLDDPEAAADLPVLDSEGTVAQATAPPPEGPGILQAFSFDSTGEAACPEAAGGLVVQNAGSVPALFNINGLAVVMQGTVIFTQQQVTTPDGEAVEVMGLYLADGSLAVSIGGENLALSRPWQSVSVSLAGADDNMLAMEKDPALIYPETDEIARAVCENAVEAGVFELGFDCTAEARYVYKITATNDLDWPVSLWIDAATSVDFAAEATRSFLVTAGPHDFQVCNQGAEPDSDQCGETESRVIDAEASKVWTGWRPAAE